MTIRPFEGGAELADLALQEIDDLLRRDDDGLAADVLGLLTAAAGPLAVADLAAMSAVAPQSAALTRRIRRLVTVEAARSLQPVGLAKGDRYQFAHGSLLEQAQENEDLSDPDYLRRIHQWADSWQAAGWPPMDGAGHGTPRYLLDTYPSTLTEDPPRLAALAGDAGWVTAAIQTLGVDAVLAELKTAGAAAPGEPRLAAMHAVVRRPGPPPARPGSGRRSRVRAAPAVPAGGRTRRNPPRRRLPDPAACLRRSWPGAPVDHAAGKPGPDP